MQTISVETTAGDKVEVKTKEAIAQLAFTMVIEAPDTPEHLRKEMYALREVYDTAHEA